MLISPRLPQRSAVQIRSFALSAVTALTFATAISLGADGSAPIEDRNGTALYIPPNAAEQQAGSYPFRALAPQLLTALRDSEPTGGKLKLTLDSRVQTITEEVLRAVPRGAAVVLNVQNGDILAMASVPSFDPNALTDSERTRLAGDPTEPLANRALQAYAPGSTFMIVTALAGAGKGLASARYDCLGSVTYGANVMKCWIAYKTDESGGHGNLGLDEALKVSCGPYFYQYGNAAGIDEIDTIGALLGLGQKSGLSLPGEGSGILPGPAWLKEISPGERWSAGYTANTAIGQGFTLATPLQMAAVIATVGNGGHVVSPRLHLDAAPNPPVDLQQYGVTPEDLEIIQRGLRKVVEEGAGKRAQVNGTKVAGKTGTAQFWRGKEKDNHTWFVAYAPAEQPKIAVCVLVQGAKSGGAVAAPLAGKIIAQSLSATLPPPHPIEPAKGSFEQMDSIAE